VGARAADREVAERAIGAALVPGVSGARRLRVDVKVQFGWEVFGECRRGQGHTRVGGAGV